MIRLYLFTLFAILLNTTVGAAPKPNILYLYVDDMGWGSIGPNKQWERKQKGLPHVLTPNLDALARRGVNFSRAYGCTVCSPARSSQQTGYHQGHTFADRNDPDNAKKAIRTADITIGDALSKAGYTTGYWGKWGYGGSKDQKSPKIQNIQTLPTSHGYQFVLTELHHVRAHTFFQPTLWSAPAKPNSAGGLELVDNSMAKYLKDSTYSNSPALQNHPEYPETAYCDDSYCFAALDFIRTQAQNYNKNGNPFIGILAVQVPHAPFGEISQLPEWDRDYQSQKGFISLKSQTKQWAAMVTRIDGHFGNLFQALEDPNNDGDTSDSVANDTLVVFQSDNGGPGGPNNTELNANGGLRGVKGTIFEGGIRVPTIMSWPAKMQANSKLKPGTTTDHILDVSDLLPTFCELAGVQAPIGIDGVSIAPLIDGSGEPRTRNFLIHEAGKGSSSIIRGKDKLIRTKKGLELYDLEKDHSEATDLANARPKLVKELEKLLLAERVAEPRGFANTYHRWEGENNATTSNPDNWSDYKYENSGKTYQEDNGKPRVSWCAKIENKTNKPVKAIADSDLAFLGLEILGGKQTQELHLKPNINLAARNELRLGKNAILTLDGGTVSSLRWIDLYPGSSLRGSGKLVGKVYNQGTLELAANRNIEIEGEYSGSATAQVALNAVSPWQAPLLQISGSANLGGKLQLNLAKDCLLTPGVRYPLLKANQITGKLLCPDTRFTIHQTQNEISISLSIAGGS